MKNAVRTRFAPSPTGYLHIGGLRTAMYAYLFAKKHGGDFILRIEDTDLERYVPGAVEIIYRTLKDAGLTYSEGPDVGGKYGPYVQTLRKDIYTKYAKQLVELGGAYYCFCSKERLDQQKDKDGLYRYDKHCLGLSNEQIQQNLDKHVPYVIRQNIPAVGTSEYTDLVFGTIAVDYKDLEDNILIKSDGLPTYNFANVIDDHLMNITHVIRGTEYLSSTPKYNLLYDSFHWQRPQYIHLPPIMKDEKQKLSKRNGDASYEDLIKKGYLKEAIINYIALLGWSPKNNVEKMSLLEMQELFSIDGLSRSAAIFDPQKLTWLNGEYIKALPFEKFKQLAAPFLKLSAASEKYDNDKILKLLHARVDTLAQVQEKIEFLTHFGKFDDGLYENKKSKCNADCARVLLSEALQCLTNLEEYSNDKLFFSLQQLAERLQVKSGQLFWALRVAITGQESTPGGATEMAELLGKSETLQRLTQAIDWLK